jgi:microcystin-dependent protein
MATPYLGEIREAGFNFAPIGWLPCDGRLLPISQYDALYALIGTTYGGDGITTFAIPDLQSRVAVHQGQLNGNSTVYVMGQKTGFEQVTILSSQMAAHTHTVAASTEVATLQAPTVNSTWAQVTQDGTTILNGYSAPPANATLAPGAVSSMGGNLPLPILQPYLAVNYMIAVQGIFPTQG